MGQACKECREYKVFSEYYSHPEGNNGVLGRCKECIRRGRKSEKERKMARVIDVIRAKLPDRQQYITENTRKYRANNPLKYKAHTKINNYYSHRKEERPSICSNCSSDGYIHLHHEDYNKPNEVIPLCALCHSKHHNNKIHINVQVMILTIPF